MKRYPTLGELPSTPEKAELTALKTELLALGYVKLGDVLRRDFDKCMHLCFLMDKLWPGRVSPDLMYLVKKYWRPIQKEVAL